MDSTLEVKLWPLQTFSSREGSLAEARVALRAAARITAPQPTSSLFGTNGKRRNRHVDSMHAAAPSPSEGAPAGGEPSVVSTALVVPTHAEPDLEERSQYIAASFIAECERGTVLSRVEPSHLKQCPNWTAGYLSSADGTRGSDDAASATAARQFHVYPIEEGRYKAAVTVPPCALKLLGTAVLSLIINTSVKGYDITSTAASAASVPTYFPLDARLKEDSAAVQRAVQSRVSHVAHLVTRMLFQLSARKTKGGAGRTERAEAVMRLAWHRPCHLRTAAPLRTVLHRMLRDATRSVSAASLSGPMTAYGIGKEEKRFTAVASALWFRGHPLYSSNTLAGAIDTSGTYEEHLLPGALAVLADDYHAYPSLQGFRAASSASENRITMKCIAMDSHYQRLMTEGGCTARGFVNSRVRPEEIALQAASSLVLSMTTRTGWTVSILLVASAIPFKGVPLQRLIVQTREMLLGPCEQPSFYSFMYSHSIAQATRVPTSDVNGSYSDGSNAPQPSLFGLGLPWLQQVKSISVMYRVLGSHGLGAASVRPHSVRLLGWAPRAQPKNVTADAVGGGGGNLFSCLTGNKSEPHILIGELGDDDVDERSQALGSECLGEDDEEASAAWRDRLEGTLRVFAAQRSVMRRRRCYRDGHEQSRRKRKGVFTVMELSQEVVAAHVVESTDTFKGHPAGLVYLVCRLHRRKKHNSGDVEDYDSQALHGFTSWLLSVAQ